jgi:hypothetical protein
MKQVIVNFGINPCQIDDFSEKDKRSVIGSLHINPKSTIMMTDDELNHIKENYKGIYKFLTIIPDKKKIEYFVPINEIREKNSKKRKKKKKSGEFNPFKK